MKTILRNCLATVFIASLYAAINFSCAHDSTPLDTQSSEYAVTEIRNIIWKLSAAEQNGRTIDIPRLSPFHLIFRDTTFLGDDGCNSYGADFVARNDTIFPSNLVQTLKLCNIATVSLEHLAAPFRLLILQGKLRILTSDGVYTYTSEVTDAVADSVLVEKQWAMTNSTDPDFSEIQAQELRPVLTFTANKMFEVRWLCVPENIFGCNAIRGIFGTGPGGMIRLYEGGSEVSGVQGYDLMQRLLGATSYVAGADSLVLRNKAADMRYEFSNFDQ